MRPEAVRDAEGSSIGAGAEDCLPSLAGTREGARPGHCAQHVRDTTHAELVRPGARGCVCGERDSQDAPEHRGWRLQEWMTSKSVSELCLLNNKQRKSCQIRIRANGGMTRSLGQRQASRAARMSSETSGSEKLAPLYRASFALGDLQLSYLLPLSFLLCVLSKRRMKGSYLRVLPLFLLFVVLA